MDFPFPTSPEQAGGGILVSFVSLRAGSGASTLGCLHALYCSEGKDTGIIDLNPESRVRTYLGLPEDVSSASITDISGVNEEKDIYVAGEKIHSNVYVFPGVPRIMDVSQIDANLCMKSAVYLKHGFDISTAVLGPLYGPSWGALLLSDLICVVVTPDRIICDAFRDSMDFISRLDCGDRVKIILNKQGVQGGLRKEDAVKVFSPDYVIDYDRSIRAGCNQRKPLLTKKLREVFSSLIKEVTKVAG